MTDNEIRIISRKKKELFEKANPIAILKLLLEKTTEEDVKKNPEAAKEKIKSFEAMHQMKMLDDLMEELGYEWDISQDLYIEKKGDSKSYADAWDAVTGRKKDSEEDEETDEDDSENDDDEDGENCDACELNGRCPIQNAKGKTETTIIHHHDEIKDKDFKRDLLNNPDLRIAVKDGGIAIIGEASTMKLMNLTCELLKIISKSGARAVRETIRLYNMKTTDKTLKLHLRREKEED